MATDFLFPHDRALRLPIPDWTSILARKLDDCDIKLPCNLAQICNETALMLAMGGQVDMASSLLRHESQWLENHGHIQLLAHCWINRCRIWLVTGHAEEAVSCLGHMGGVAMSPDVPQTLFALLQNDEPEFRQLRHTWVIETLRSLLKARRFNDLFVLSNSVAANCPHETTNWFLIEARATAYAEQGEFGRACKLVDAHVSVEDPAVALTFQLKGAEIRAVAGQLDGALRQASRSFEAAMQLRTETATQALAWFRFLERTATLLNTLGSPKGAILATRGLTITREIPDIPTIASFLAVLEEKDRLSVYGTSIEALLMEHQFYSLLPRYGCAGSRKHRLNGETASLVQNIASTLNKR